MVAVMMVVAGVLVAALALRVREQKDNARKLEELLPLWKIERDTILSRNGDMTAAFRLNLPEIFTLSNEEYGALHTAWVKALRVLPPLTVVHKQDFFTKGCYRADFNPEKEQSFLSRASEKFFNERPLLSHECLLYITAKPRERKPASSAFSNLLRRSIVPAEGLNGKLKQRLEDSVGQFQRILSDSGLLQMERLTETELVGETDKAGILERYLMLLEADARPVLKDIIFKPEFSIGENYCQLFTLGEASDLPAKCGPYKGYDRYCTDKTKFSIGFASSLGQLLSCNHIYNQFFVIEDAPKTLKRLEAKRLRLQSLSAYSRENAIARDATSDFLNEAISEGRQPIKAHFNLLAWTNNREELKELRNEVSSALAQMDATPRQETKGAPQIFWAGLPGNAGELPANDCFDTFLEQAVCFMNMETAYHSSVSPFGIRLADRLSGKPLLVDISDLPMKKGWITNRSKFVLGPSGSGKSYFMANLCRHYYEQGSHIVMVDVGHSYKGLCTFVGGYYFTYEESNPIRFNPFFVASDDYMDTEKKESIKTLLLALWKKDTETFKRSEYVALSNALTLYFEFVEKVDIFPCFDSFYEFLREHFVEVLRKDRVKDRDFDIDNFLYVLRPYYKGGEFDYLLNARENLDLLHERFIVFELDAIKDHPTLFSVVTLTIMSAVLNKMRKLKGVRKVVVIEEAWKAIAREGMAEYIKYLFKTMRKFYGEPIVVTQEAEDIISSPIVKEAIINNSDCKILLDQSKYQNKFDQIQQLLGLTEKDKALILSINKANDPTLKYKEVFIGLGSNWSRVYRTETSLEEYLTYSTEESEKVKVQAYAARYGGDIRKGISALAADIRAGAA